MRIIGGHDYYDKAMAHGSDPNVRLIRNSAYVDLDYEIKPIYLPEMRRKFITYEFKRIYVVVCDKLYSCVYFSYHKYENQRYKKIEKYIWTFDEWNHEFNEDAKPGFTARFLLDRYAQAEEFFAHKTIPNHVKDYMLSNGYSILIGAKKDDKIKWKANPDCLRDIEFYRVINAWDMYQQLDMWVSGVLTSSGNPPVQITDNRVKIEKHGFDNRVSFRHRKD